MTTGGSSVSTCKFGFCSRRKDPLRLEGCIASLARRSQKARPDASPVFKSTVMSNHDGIHASIIRKDGTNLQFGQFLWSSKNAVTASGAKVRNKRIAIARRNKIALYVLRLMKASFRALMEIVRSKNGISFGVHTVV